MILLVDEVVAEDLLICECVGHAALELEVVDLFEGEISEELVTMSMEVV